jgi:hypothetical protein
MRVDTYLDYIYIIVVDIVWLYLYLEKFVWHP